MYLAFSVNIGIWLTLKRFTSSFKGVQIALPPKEKLIYPALNSFRKTRLVQILPGPQMTNVKSELMCVSLDDSSVYLARSNR